MAMVMGVASAAADEVTLTKTDGSASGLVWTSTTSPVTTITLSGGGFLDYDDGIGINVAGETRTVTIATTSGYCHVTGYSMTVTGFSGDGVIITAGDQTLTTDATDQVFAVSGIAEGDQASFTIAPTEAGHAKKMIVKSLTVTYELKNEAYVSLLKSGWSVSACSSAPSEGGSSNGTGEAANLIDDNAGTYWHSNWIVCNESSRHFFEINLGESKTFDACSFMQRQNANAWNGAFQDVSIFVGSSPFGLTHDNIASFLESNTPVATVTLLSNDKSEQYLYFDTPQTGQYVLVVPTLTVNPGNGANANNKYACLAEFSLYEKSSALTSANAEIAQKKAEVLAGMEMFFGSKGLFLSAEQTALTAAVNNVAELTELTAISQVAEKLAEIEAVGESVYSTLSGRLVYVVNTRRQALGQAPYLTVMENGNVNTINYRSELGKWMLVRDGQTANFRLYSLEKDGYLVVVDNKGLVNANGQKFYFDANSYNDNVGLAMHYVDNGNGFNIDTSGNPLTSWSSTDNGSSWVFELAGSMAEDLTDGSYYRIRSNRGMYNADGSFKTAGSLLGINTVVTDGATEGERQQIHVGKDGLGAIWQLKAVDGGFQAYNVAADFNGNDLPFALGARGDGSNKEPRQAYAVAADNAETMVVFNAKGSGIGSYNGRIPYSLAVKTPAVGNSCMDINGDGVPVLNEWNPEAGEYNNGTIYYFEALAEEELNAMKDAYVAAAAGVDVSEFETADAFYQGYEPLFGDAFSAYSQTVNELKEALANEEMAVATDVKSANAAFTTNAGITASYRARLTEASEALEAELPEIAAEANGRQVHFYNVQYPASMLAAGASTMAVATDATNVTTVWTLEQTEGMKYRLLNHGTGAYAGHYDRTDGSSNGSISVPVASTADEACEYELVLFGDGQVGLQAGTGSYPLLHRDGQNRVVKWTSTSEASKWTASMVDTDPVVIDYQKVDFGCTAVEDVVNSIYFEAQAGSTLAISQGLGAHHTILVERFDPSAFPSQQAEAVMLAAEDDAAPVPTHTYTISKDDLTVNGNRLEYVPEDEAIEPGVLRMTAPMGFFTVDGKLSAPFTVHFTVASDGTTTGIDEVTEAAQAEAQWYTVQGVRVAAPSAAGIYVRVAGGKATKVYVGL